MRQIDVILVTFARPTWLRRCVESLRAAAAHSKLDLRILAAVNGDDPESAAVLSALGVTHESFSKTTPADARNRLLELASADWICFIDDDAYVDESYFDCFLSAARRSPDAAAIGGPNLTPPQASRFERAAGEVLAHRFATFTSSARYVAKGVERSCDGSSLILCNLFVRRLALTHTRFPESVVCAEENSLLAQLARQGHRMLYAPELHVYHERRCDLRDLTRQVYKYGRGRGQILRLRHEKPRLAHLLPSLCLAYALVALPVLALSGAKWFALLLPFTAYGLLTLYVLAAHTRDRLACAPLFAVIHVFYGAGVISGILRR